jgi:putative addiction module component (TIGR02574 family)
VPEKILRVQDLWEEIARTPREVEITPAQREEAERRFRKHEQDPGEYSSWEEIKERLEGEM